MKQLVALLLVVYSVSITRVLGQITASFDNDKSGFCCNSKPRPQVHPTPLNLLEVVYDSPNYGQVVTPSAFTKRLDNVCYTYSLFNNYSAIQFTGITFCDGSYIISKYITAVLLGYSGVARTQGFPEDSGSSTVVYDEVYLGSACPGLRVWYRNYIAGRCDILEDATENDTVSIHGDSSSRDICDYCKSQVVAVARSKNLGCGGNLELLPNLLNRHCVTQYNGIRCVNAEKVLPQDAVILSSGLCQ